MGRHQDQPRRRLHLPPQLLPAAASGGETSTAGGLLRAVEDLERRMIQEALDQCGGVKARAARTLGVTERILAYKMDGYGMARKPPPA